MKNKLPAIDADAHSHHNTMYHTHSSSSYTIREGHPNRNYGFEMREAIQREIEKEVIRGEIIADEIERRRILENELRNELMMERMSSGRGGFCSPVSLPAGHSNLFDPRIMHRQPIGLEERIIISIDEKYSSGGHHRENRRLSVSPFQRLGDSPEIKEIYSPSPLANKKEVIVLGKPNGETLSGIKRKSTPSGSQGTIEPHTDNSKKKVKEEWSCAICQVSATSERGLNEHIQGKKHQAKEADLIAQKTGANFGLGVTHKKPIVKPVKVALKTVNLNSSEQKKPQNRKISVTEKTCDSNKVDGMNGENKRDKFRFWCDLCQVGVLYEKVMNNHKKGKKHLANLYRKGQVGSEKTCDIEEKTETETEKTVVEMVAAEEKTEMETETKMIVELATDEEKTEMENNKSMVVQVVKTVTDDMENVAATDLGDYKMKTGVVEDLSI